MFPFKILFRQYIGYQEVGKKFDAHHGFCLTLFLTLRIFNLLLSHILLIYNILS